MVISYRSKVRKAWKNRFSIVDPQTVRDILLEHDGADIFTRLIIKQEDYVKVWKI